MKKSPLLSIFLIVLVDVLGLTIILPLLPFYAESLGAPPAVVGMLVSAYAACQLIAGPPLGHLSDRVGRRPVLLVSQIGTCAGFLILASATSLWMVFLARVIDGLTAGNLTVAQAYISDVTEPENRAKSFGMIGALIQGGGMGSLVKRFGESRLVQMGFATMALGFALLSGAAQLLYLLIAIAFLTFGSAILRPSLTSLITTRAARHQQGMVIG